MSVDEGRPEGWYSDPDNPFQHRWWDGAAWTDRTQPLAGLASQDEAPPVQPPTPSRPKRPFWYSWWFRVILIIVVTAIIALIKRGVI